MKKLIFVLFLLLVLVSSVPVCAESAFVPASDADVQTLLEEMFSEIGLDYCNVILNEEKKIFVIDMAVDGLTSNLLARKNLGLGESKSWLQAKANYTAMHDYILGIFKAVGRDDLRLILNMVNDDAYLREDYSTISNNPLLSVGIFGTIDVDVMSEWY